MKKRFFIILLQATIPLLQSAIFNPQSSIFRWTGVSLLAQSSSPGYKWAFNPGANMGDFGNAIAKDGSGNIYVTGSFQGTADFDPGAGTATLTAAGNPETFVAKYNSAGAYQWAFNVQAALGGTSAGYDIVIGSGGGVFITGNLLGTSDFDPGAGTANLSSAGGRDIFVAKYSSNGIYQWAYNFGNTADDYGYGIALDSSNNVHITGSYQNTVDFDPGAGTSNLSGLGGDEIFVAKYSTSGTFQWALGIPSINPNDVGKRIATDGSGNVLVTGYFRGPADFDPGAGTNTLTSNGQTDIFVAKYNLSGTFLWAFNIGSNTDNDYGQDITTDGNGNVVVTGYFRNSPDFDPGAGTATLSSSGWDDIYVAKYNSSGAYQWAFNIGGGSGDYGFGVATDIPGNIYITGYFTISADFDPGAPTVNLTGNGGTDIYVAKYNGSGVFQWAFNAGSSLDDNGSEIVVDATGNIFVTGTFLGTADFDPGTGTVNLTPVGGYDFFVAKYCQVNPSIAVTDASCYDGNNGSATATPLDGSAPYTYLWSNSGNQSTATGLAAGTYTVTVTDGTGCSDISSAIVTQPPDFNFGYWFPNTSCNGSNDGNVNISFVSGATPPYTYLWSNGETGTTIDSLFAGVYSATITDAAGCDTTFSVTITDPPDISYSVTSTNITCNGLDDGTIAVNATGGTGQFYYSVDSGITYQMSPSFNNLQPDSYHVFIRDDNSCTKDTFFVITEPPPVVITSYSGTNVTCNGGNDGTITFSASGGTGSLRYSLVGGPIDQISGIFTGLIYGDYQLFVRDSIFCGLLGPFVQITQPALISPNPSFSPISCNGGNNGTATVNATGGTGGFYYLWDNGQDSVTATGLIAGNYSFTVTDSSSCSSVGSVSVTEPAILSTAMNSTNVLCFGSNNGTASVTASGGNAPYTYQWSNSGTSSSIITLVANTYTVTITDSKGCSVVNSTSVSQPDLLTGTLSKSDVSCTGFCDGIAIVVVSGGTSPYIYLWNPTNQTTSAATGLCTGNYTVNLADANNCQTTPNITISEPAPVIVTTFTTDATCSHSDGSATVTVGGGTSPYSFNWSNGASDSFNSGLMAANYSVTVTDSNGCDTTSSATVGVVAVTQPICIVTVDSATKKNLLSWEKTAGMGTQGFIIYKEIFTNVYDSIGSVPYDSLSEYVDFASDPKTKAERYKIATIDSCGNISLLSDSHRTILLTASVGVNNERNLAWNDYEGITLIMQYRIWRGTALNNITLIDSVVYGTNLYADWDTLSGVDSLYYFIELVHPAGCTSTIKLKTYNASKSNTASLQAPSLPMNITVLVSNVSCNGGNDGTATATITGGEAPYTYLWDDPQTQTDSTATGLTAGTYNVTVTDNNSTTISGIVIITEPAVITVSASIADANSPGNDDGAINLTVSGGTPPYTFAWSNGATTEDIDSLPADTYTVVITDANNCQAVYTDTVKLIVNGNHLIMNTDFLLLVYPNPNRGDFIIDLQNAKCKMQNIKCKIQNILGEEVFNSQFLNPKSQIFLDLPEGIYALRVEEDGEVMGIVRIIINK